MPYRIPDVIGNVLLVLRIIASLLVLRIKAHCSNVYGLEPCSFLPAPPGKTPPCAQPGLTYCEHPDNYPKERIQYLIKKWRFDHTSLLKDETKEEFSSYFYPPPIYKHGHYGLNTQNSYYPEPIHIPKPPYIFDENTRLGNTYIPPNVASPYNYTSNNLNNFGGYVDRTQYQPQGQLLNYKYSSNIPPYSQPSSAIPYELTQQQSQPYSSLSLLHSNPYLNKIWNRKDEEMYGKTLLIRKRRSEQMRRSLKFLNTFQRTSNTTLVRKKRQNLIGQVLCRTRSNYIMPRAALNTQGNWMYVVNMPENNQMQTQLVKSEICESQTCSGLCTIPTGYTSRCEQKYVQKRLIALEGTGNSLNTDVFWFPSCCVCTISNT